MVAAVGLRLAALLCVLWVQSATAEWGKGGKGNWGSKDWHGGRWGHGKHQWQGQVNSQSGIETGLAIAQFLDEKKRRKSRPQRFVFRLLLSWFLTAASAQGPKKATCKGKSQPRAGRTPGIPWCCHERESRSWTSQKTDGTRTEAASWASGCGNSTSCWSQTVPVPFRKSSYQDSRRSLPRRFWLTTWMSLPLNLGTFCPVPSKIVKAEYWAPFWRMSRWQHLGPTKIVLGAVLHHLQDVLEIENWVRAADIPFPVSGFPHPARHLGGTCLVICCLIIWICIPSAANPVAVMWPWAPAVCQRILAGDECVG